jgi:hypothetical protein
LLIGFACSRNMATDWRSRRTLSPCRNHLGVFVLDFGRVRPLLLSTTKRTKRAKHGTKTDTSVTSLNKADAAEEDALNAISPALRALRRHALGPRVPPKPPVAGGGGGGALVANFSQRSAGRRHFAQNRSPEPAAPASEE